MVKEVIIAVLRQLISVGVGVWITKLTESGVATEVQIVAAIGVVVAFFVNIVWLVTERLLKRWNLTAALNLESGAVNAHIEEVARAVSFMERVRQARLPDDELHDAVRSAINEQAESPSPKVTST